MSSTSAAVLHATDLVIAYACTESKSHVGNDYMEHEIDVDEDSSSDASSHLYFFKHVGRHRQCSDSALNEDQGRHIALPNVQPTPAGSQQVGSNNSPCLSPAQLQEMVIKALFQSSASLIGSSSSMLHHAGEASIGIPSASTGDPVSSMTWSEATYHLAEAKRKKKPDLMRISAGEESDSQEDFPLPENATPEQRTLRTRRLNRCRAKKARDLTSNRKAVKKLPYVIHVDGMCKPRGIHRHLWKAAVRGQCGRLDPSMDNINHHPKHVVDSIWHALEKEWEFTGYAHKAREMFEKSATKFMRNKKMQLKYKCLKNVDGPKPDDVSPMHWRKIVDLTKKSVKEQGMGPSCESLPKFKNVCSEEKWENDEKQIWKGGKTTKSDSVNEDNNRQPVMTAETKELHENIFGRRPKSSLPTMEVEASKEDDVDAQIRNLRSQLQWLEKSRKPQHDALDDLCDVVLHVTESKGTVSQVRRVSDSMKENVAPPAISAQKESKFSSATKGKATEVLLEEDPLTSNTKRTTSAGIQSAGDRSLQEQISDVNRAQMECGDVISMTAIIRDKEEDVGKGILMGLAGSKLARKVIPKGWCSVKVNSCTAGAGSEACPFPSGWKEQMKYKTLRDAQGRIILWPDTQLYI